MRIRFRIVSSHLLIFFVRVQHVDQLGQIVGDQILEHQTIRVHVAGARFGHLRLTLRLARLARNVQRVLVVVLLHAGAGLPCYFLRADILDRHRKDAFLAERCVQRQDAHQHKVGADARNQNGPKQTKRTAHI